MTALSNPLLECLSIGHNVFSELVVLKNSYSHMKRGKRNICLGGGSFKRKNINSYPFDLKNLDLLAIDRNVHSV